MSGYTTPAIQIPQVQAPNPIENYLRFALTQNALNQGRLFQQDLAARNALGQAVQQATNPQTGAVDTGKMMAAVAGNPAAALVAPDAARQAQALTQAQLDQHIKQLGYMNNAWGSLMADPNFGKGDLTPQVIRTGAQAVADGVIDRNAFVAGLSTFPAWNPADAQGAAAAQAQWLQQKQLQNQTAGDQLRAMRPTPQFLNDGKTNIGIVASPLTGQISRAGGNAAAVPVQTTPEYDQTPTQIGTTPNGAPIMGTRQQFDQAATSGGLSALTTGRVPTALRNPNAPPAQPGVVTGLGPAAEAAQATTGSASAQAFQGIADQGVQAKQQGAVLANMRGDTTLFTTGPGQDKIKAFRTAVQRYLPGLASGMGLKPEQIAANESFDKLAAQIATAQGAGSDARMAVAQTANPSSHLSPAGADMILAQLQGNADYLQARAKLAAGYPNRADRAGFEANVAGNLDPRVFQYARMTPDQKMTFFKTMKDTGAFKKSYRWAQGQGLLGGAQ